MRAAETRPIPPTEAERRAIREQLERMLANPLFTHSRRYPTLLRYIVEHTLAGDRWELKERTLGVAVFGRDPDYDTNADPIVRTTAAEIRKRIAQYYHEPGHEHDLRIDLLPGSYVPEFGLPPAGPAAAGPPAGAGVKPKSRRRRAAGYAATLTIGAALAVAAGRAPWTRQTALDRFWRPVLASSNSVLLCVGQREFLGTSPESEQQSTADLPRAAGSPSGFHAPVTLFKLYYLGSQNVALHDVLTLGRLAGLLQAKGKAYQIRGQSSISFSDLRNGPVVLVGALDNDWTMRLTGQTRFGFEREGAIFWIKDGKHPARRNRMVDYSTPYRDLTEDYALISRVLDPTTERMAVVAGGLTGFGTIAAGEFLTTPGYMEEIAKAAPVNWDSKNVQVVIATKVIDGVSGPPRIVERQFW